MANNYKRWLCEESLKTPSSRPTLIYFEFRSKPSLITVICMNPHSPNKFNLLRQNIVFSYSERIPVSFSWLFHYFSFFFGYFTFLLILTKIILLLLFYYIFFFMKIIFIFSCSGMFRDVPRCSMFLVLSTPLFSRPDWQPLGLRGWASTSFSKQW